MRAGVSAAMLRRVDALVERAHVPGRYLAVPLTMLVDQWEEMAMASQERLARSHHEDVEPLHYAETYEQAGPPRGGVLQFRIIRTPIHHPRTEGLP